MLGWGSLYNGRQSNGRCNRASGDYQTIEAELKPPSSDHYPGMPPGRPLTGWDEGAWRQLGVDPEPTL